MKRALVLASRLSLAGLLLACGSIQAAQPEAWTQKAPDGVMQAMEQGEPQDLIVLFDDAAIRQAAEDMRRKLRVKTHTAAVQAMKAARYKTLKQDALKALPVAQHEMLKDYSHLPMAFVRFHTAASLRALLQRSDVVAVYRDEKRYPILTQSLPLIGQNSVSAAGDQGINTTVLVIDSGVNYTLPAFGSCTAAGAPASCRVIYYQNIADSSTSLDTTGHGSVVSAITLGVAPQTNIAMINVFGANQGADDNLIIAAINFGILNQAALNIVAMNMSLGNTSKNTEPCGNRGTNPFVTAIEEAKAAGIVATIASGNDAYSKDVSGNYVYTNGLASPACTPGAVSVGAVYDANVGGRSFLSCSDSSTAADKPACYSNSANYLTLLAPGSIVSTAVGGGDGTSFAAPMVAGAVAVLRSALMTETVDQTVARLTSSGKPVTDARNGVTTPRLNLLAAAARPANDAFANRIVLSGASGGMLGSSVFATLESGEPAHAGIVGGNSVWWKWVSPGEGQVSLDTLSSTFDTVLAVYTGGAVNALTPIAGNDDVNATTLSSSVLFQAHAGVEYQIAVDGYNGDAGDIALNWSFNANASADLSVTGSATPSAVTQGDNISYSLTVLNAGPQVATGAVLSVALPANTTLVSASAACSLNGANLICPLGTLSANASANIVFTLQTSSTTPSSITAGANVSAEPADPNAANNSLALNTTVNPPAPPPPPPPPPPEASNDTDVPTLPEWGAILMASVLLTIGYRRRQRGAVPQ